MLAGMAYNLHIDPSNRRYKLSGINVVPPRSYRYIYYIYKHTYAVIICLRLTAGAKSAYAIYIKYSHVDCGWARLKRKQTQKTRTTLVPGL